LRGGQRRERRVALDVLPVLVEEDGAVAVAVVGDPHVGVGGANEAAEVAEVLPDRLGVAPREVAVGLGVDRDDLTAELAVELGGRERPRPVAGVERDGEVGAGDQLAVDVRAHLRHVVVVHGVDRPRLADALPVRDVELLGEDVALDAFEAVDGEFNPVVADELDPVVLRRVVRGRDDDGRHRLGVAVVDGAGRRDDPESVHVDADAREPGCGGVREHLTRRSGVAGDGRAVDAPLRPRGLRHPQDELRGELLAGDPPRAARPE
jgi:hypothetical protein